MHLAPVTAANLVPMPKTVPHHGSFVIGSTGSKEDPARIAIGIKTGTRFYKTAGSTSVADALVGAQQLAAKDNQLWGVIRPDGGHPGLLFVVPLFRAYADRSRDPISTIAELGAGLVMRSAKLLGLADATSTLDTSAVPVGVIFEPARG